MESIFPLLSWWNTFVKHETNTKCIRKDDQVESKSERNEKRNEDS